MLIEAADYNFEESLSRIDQMLSFQIKNDEAYAAVPTFADLPAKGGIITYCSVMHIVINLSSGSYSQQLRLYRAFLSEAVAILSSDRNCVDILVQDKHLTAVFTTPFKNNIESMIDKSAMINTLAQVVSRKSNGLGLPELSVVIGIDYGEAMLMRFGKLNITEVNPEGLVWIGRPMERARKLTITPEHKWNIWISTIIYHNLSEEYTKFFHYEDEWGCYGAGIINTYMKNWLNRQ